MVAPKRAIEHGIAIAQIAPADKPSFLFLVLSVKEVKFPVSSSSSIISLIPSILKSKYGALLFSDS